MQLSDRCYLLCIIECKNILQVQTAFFNMTFTPEVLTKLYTWWIYIYVKNLYITVCATVFLQVLKKWSTHTFCRLLLRIWYADCLLYLYLFILQWFNIGFMVTSYAELQDISKWVSFFALDVSALGKEESINPSLSVYFLNMYFDPFAYESIIEWHVQSIIFLTPTEPLGTRGWRGAVLIAPSSSYIFNRISSQPSGGYRFSLIREFPFT